MSDQEYKWGDDPGAAIEKAAGTPLAVQIEEDVVAGYLLLLRTLLERDSELTARVAACNPAKLALDELVAACKMVKPGTAHLVGKAANILLTELEQQRKADPSLYLVSCKTGRAVMPITADKVFTPPDFEGLDGRMHKSRPIVHPGLSSSLAIASHESAKEIATMALSGGEIAFVHLSAPEQMVEMARQKLGKQIVFGNVQGPWQEVEFGKENVAGMEQSVNLAFHRVELFSSVLARRILAMCGQGGRCDVGKVRSHRGAKHRWYSLSVKIERIDASSADKRLS